MSRIHLGRLEKASNTPRSMTITRKRFFIFGNEVLQKYMKFEFPRCTFVWKAQKWVDCPGVGAAQSHYPINRCSYSEVSLTHVMPSRLLLSTGTPCSSREGFHTWSSVWLQRGQCFFIAFENFMSPLRGQFWLQLIWFQLFLGKHSAAGAKIVRLKYFRLISFNL